MNERTTIVNECIEGEKDSKRRKEGLRAWGRGEREGGMFKEGVEVERNLNKYHEDRWG